MKMLKAYIPIISVFFLALLVRIVYNVTVAADYQPLFDAALYDTIARHIVNDHCYCLDPLYSTVSRPPLWPFIIAIIYFFAGQQEFYARLFYCFLGSIICVLVYLLAKDLFGRRVALLTGIVAAIYTGLFIYDGWLYSESLYTFCLTAFTYSLYRLQHSPFLGKGSEKKKFSPTFWRQQLQIVRPGWVILCGILIGLAALTRPNGIFLLGLVYVWAVLVVLTHIISWKIVVKDVLIITCITLIIIAPWTYRNYRVTHSFVLVSTGMGEVLLGAYNDNVVYGDPIVRGMWRLPAGSVNHDMPNYTPANDRADTKHALSWMSRHIPATLSLLGLHLRNMWIPYTYSHGLPIEEFPHRPSSQIVIDMITTMSIFIFSFAAFGFFITRKRWKHLLVVYLLIALTIVQNMVFYGDMRFRSSIEPFLVLFAGGAFWFLRSVSFGPLYARLKKRFAPFPKAQV
jgi:4-amino-4-deoxy-L-arabinose transferase-like glycosyltransferase